MMGKLRRPFARLATGIVLAGGIVALTPSIASAACSPAGAYFIYDDPNYSVVIAAGTGKISMHPLPGPTPNVESVKNCTQYKLTLHTYTNGDYVATKGTQYDHFALAVQWYTVS